MPGAVPVHVGQQCLLMLGHTLPVRKQVLQHGLDLTGDIVCRLVAEFQQPAVVGREMMLLPFNRRPRILHRGHIDLEPNFQRSLLDHTARSRMLYVSSNWLKTRYSPGSGGFSRPASGTASSRATAGIRELGRLPRRGSADARSRPGRRTC